MWRARLIARETTDLSLEAALFADGLIAAMPRRIGQVKAAQLVQEARLYFDPDRALADEEEALTKRGVWLRHGSAPATTDITMTLDTPDALLFDQTVTRIASDLRELGDADELDVRRARAVGILADPQFALDLLSGREAAAPSRGVRAGAANLYVHLTPADLAADLAEGTGAASIERLGAATTRLLTDWLTRFAAAGTKITLRPVLDLNTTTGLWTSTTHPKRCARPSCFATRPASSPDAAATPGPATSTTSPNTYPMEDGGPPGQTRPGNLAPLCRTHHRVKTHTAWHYKRLDDGSYEWTAPTGTSTASRLLRVVRPLVSSDHSLRSLLDHRWLRAPRPLVSSDRSLDPCGCCRPTFNAHDYCDPRWLRSERSERLETMPLGC